MSKNTKQTQTSSNVELAARSGRFVGLTVRTSSGERQYCAKILSLTPSYVNFYDVNAKINRKVARKSVVS